MSASELRSERGQREGRGAAAVRQGDTPFLESFVTLQRVVRAACESADRWETKVSAAIEAALLFAASNPARAEALTINARRESSVDGDREREVLTYFADELSAVTPEASRHPVSTDEGVVESIATAIRGHLLAGTEEKLPSLAPELVYLALMPYGGLAEARRWAEATEVRGSTGFHA